MYTDEKRLDDALQLAKRLHNQLTKLESILILTDPAVSDVEMNSVTLRQITAYNEYVATEHAKRVASNE